MIDGEKVAVDSPQLLSLFDKSVNIEVSKLKLARQSRYLMDMLTVQNK